MSKSPLLKLRTRHTVMIVMLLFACSVTAYHDISHADLLDDNCQIAQLTHNSASFIPAAIYTYVLPFTSVKYVEFKHTLIQTSRYSPFLARAPPQSLL